MLGGAKYHELRHENGHVIHRLRSKGYELPKNVADVSLVRCEIYPYFL
jgi:hypothetical protein